MTPPDDLQKLYAEANALDDRRPAQRVRDAALAHARMVLAAQKPPMDATHTPAQQRPSLWAANLPSWKAALVASVLLVPVLGLLVFRAERELPPGEQVAMQSQSKTADAVAPHAAESVVTPSTRGPTVVATAAANTAGHAKGKVSEATADAARTSVTVAAAVADRPDHAQPATNIHGDSKESSGLQIASAPPPEHPSRETRVNSTPTAPPPTSAPLAAAPPTRSDSTTESAVRANHAAGAGVAQADMSALNDMFLQVVRTGNVSTMEDLLSRGAFIDARDALGKTALLLAIQSGDEASTRALLRLGANPDLADPQGTTALQLARRLGHAKIITLLESRTARER